MYFLNKVFQLTLLFPFVILPVLCQQGIDSSSSSSSSQIQNNAVEGERKSNNVEQTFYKMDSNHDSVLSLDEFTSNFSLLSNFILTKSTNNNNNNEKKGQNGFWKGFSSSTMMIIATEIGDKTFFIAAVLSMRNSRLVVFGGAISALILMTILR